MPHLAAQMFCKNARTKLAMATATESQAPKAQEATPMSIPPAVQAAGVPANFVSGSNASSASSGMLQPNSQLVAKMEDQFSVRILQQQINLIQQQQQQDPTSRLLVEQAMQKLGLAATVSPQQQLLANALAIQQSQSQARLFQQINGLAGMRYREQQFKQRSPTNNRASAA